MKYAIPPNAFCCSSMMRDGIGYREILTFVIDSVTLIEQFWTVIVCASCASSNPPILIERYDGVAPPAFVLLRFTYTLYPSQWMFLSLAGYRK
jgi:hypothetical protein